MPFSFPDLAGFDLSLGSFTDYDAAMRFCVGFVLGFIGIFALLLVLVLFLSR